MITQLGLDRHRCNVLTLGGLEQFLDPPGDAQAPLLVQLAPVTGAEQAVFGVALGRQFRQFVVAEHLRRALHQDFVVSPDTALDPRNHRPHITNAHLPRQAEVRGAEVLRHAIAFKQFKPQLAVPLHHLDRQWRRTGKPGMHLVKPQCREDLRLHQLAFHRVGEHGRLSGRVDAFVDALVELGPQARHRQKDRRPCPAQVFTEGFQAQAEEHLAAAEQRYRLHHRALGGMRQRQVRQQPVTAAGALTVGVHAAGHCRRGIHGGEAVHHALGVAGAAGGVDDRGQFFGCRQVHRLQWPGRGDDVLPRRAFATTGHRQVNQRQAVRNRGAHRIPASRLTFQAANEQQAHLGVLQHIAHGVGIGGGVQRHTDVPGHPDRQVGDDPVGGVFREQADRGLGRQIERTQVRGHAPRLVADFAPAVVLHTAIRQGLGQVDRIGGTALPVEETMQQRSLIIVVVHGRSCV
ncbi:hypothetical protein D3C81_943590 [compost metagenome]